MEQPPTAMKSNSIVRGSVIGSSHTGVRIARMLPILLYKLHPADHNGSPAASRLSKRSELLAKMNTRFQLNTPVYVNTKFGAGFKFSLRGITGYSEWYVPEY
jgi:hypothetical protein